MLTLFYKRQCIIAGGPGPAWPRSRSLFDKSRSKFCGYSPAYPPTPPQWVHKSKKSFACKAFFDIEKAWKNLWFFNVFAMTCRSLEVDFRSYKIFSRYARSHLRWYLKHIFSNEVVLARIKTTFREVILDGLKHLSS